jgi:hypothetical protein
MACVNGEPEVQEIEVAHYGTDACIQGLALTASSSFKRPALRKPKQRRINDQGGGLERSLMGEWEWAARKARKTIAGERIGFSNALFPSPWHPEHDGARGLVRSILSSEAAAVC